MEPQNKNLVKKTISLDKQYVFPEDIRYIRFENVIITIAVNTANWIILENDNQLHFFKLLFNNNLGDALKEFDGPQNDAVKVVRQIEAKNFENTQITKDSGGNPNFHFYLTNKCNLKCPHCYMFSGAKEDKELTTEEILNILTKISKHQYERVIFSGGEITTRNDLYEIVNHAHNLGLKIQLLTNGTLWSEELIKKIAPIIDEIQISIDGFSEKENAKIRGVNSFEKSLNTIEKFVQAGVFTEVGITPFYDNELKNKINEYAEFGKQLINKFGTSNFRVRFSVELLDGRDITLTDEEREEYSKIINKIYSLYYGETIDDYPFIKMRKEKRIMDNCTYGGINISSEGNVYLCSRIPSLKPIGNIKNDNLDKIIHLSKIAQNLSHIDNLKPCCNCELKYICGGGCRITYFPDLTTCDNIESITKEDIRPRKCTKKYKEDFYRLLIRTNERIFQ